MDPKKLKADHDEAKRTDATCLDVEPCECPAIVAASDTPILDDEGTL